MSLELEIKNAMAEARLHIRATLERQQQEQRENREAAVIMFAPIVAALDALANEFSSDTNIVFKLLDPASPFYEIRIQLSSRCYIISVRCDRALYLGAPKYSYWLYVKDVYEDRELLNKVFEEGKVDKLVGKLVEVMAMYEVHGCLSVIPYD